MTRRLLFVAPAACLVAAIGAFLLATDVLRLPSAVAADDVRFRVAPEKEGLWNSAELFPLGGARALLKVEDDLAYRRAMQALQRSRLRSPVTGARLIALRADAEQRLGRILRNDPDPARRSTAANLVGVLNLANASQDLALAPKLFQASVKSFQQAIALDPGNEDAKYNLELALQLQGGAQVSAKTRPGATSGGGPGAETGTPGTGY